MSQQELLKKVIQVLELTGIPYMITGSIASSLQGEPRSTLGIDILIVIQKAKANELSRAFQEPDFYLDKHSLLDAIEN